MSIITISRGSVSHGKEVAERLAEKLQFSCLSSEVVHETACKYKISESKLQHVLHDSPTFFEQLHQTNARYLDYFSSVFFSYLLQDNIVYHGLAGHFFLQNISHVLKVRITADMDDRIAEEMNRLHCTRKEAVAAIETDDEERRKWSRKLHGIDTWDSRLYDIVLHVGSLSIEDIVNILYQTIQKPQFQTTAKSDNIIKRKATVANIIAKAATYGAHPEIHLVNDTAIHLSNLSGRLKSEENCRKEFTSVLKKDFGIEDVIFNEPLLPEKSHINTFYNVTAD